ncbi:MAG: RHS repeat-associated core domain-containing protein [Halieaceae bacterium]
MKFGILTSISAACLHILLLSTPAASEEFVWRSVNEDRSGCVPVSTDLNADEVCQFFGFFNHNPSYQQCNVEGGGRRTIYRCEKCRPDLDPIVINGRTRCRASCDGALDLAGPEACPAEIEDQNDKTGCPGSTVGYPIDHANGNKRLTEVDFEGTGPFPLRFERSYNSKANRQQRLVNLRVQWGFDLTGKFHAPEINPNPYQDQIINTSDKVAGNNLPLDKLALEGKYNQLFESSLRRKGVPQWRHNYEKRLLQYPWPLRGQQAAMLVQPDGHDIRFFRYDDTEPYRPGNSAHGSVEVLSVLAGDSFDGLRLFRADGHVEEYARPGGRLLKITNPQGHSQSLTYAPDKFAMLERVDDDFGNRLSFSYDIEQRLVNMTASRNTDPGGQEDYQPYYSVDYSHVGTGWMFSSASYPGAISPRTYLYEDLLFPTALTGVIDENGDRALTYTYRETGLAETTQRGTTGNKFSLTYEPVQRTVTNPLGKDTVYRYEREDTRERIAGIDGVPTESCQATNQNIVYDDFGFKDSSTGARGFVTSYDFNSRGLATRRTEAAGTSAERTTTTVWHPDYALKTRIEDELLLTVLDYGNDGLLDSRTETDKSSFSAGSRNWTYTYYTTGPATGLVQSADGPRTDVADVTTYEYNARGLVSRITNALGQITEITDYDGWGKPTRIVDANGVVTTLTYTPRGWLDAVTVDDQATTTFDYDSVGQLIGTTLPNGVSSSYTYNDAGQLTGIGNSLGEAVAFVLDAAGNITGTNILAGNGSIVFQQQQVFDELSRLRNELGNNGQDYGHDYDLSDNRQLSNDALSNNTNRVFDPLDRLASVTDALNGITQFGYDVHDNIVSVIDPEGIATTYSYDGFDNLRDETSPNTGLTRFEYDAAENRISQTDARGVLSLYDYDALNRLTNLRYPGDPALDVIYSYDGTAGGNIGVGRLTGIQDSAGAASYSYNRLGHMTGKTETLDGLSYFWQMEYDLAGLLSRLTYPSGRVLRMERDSEGRVSAVYTQADSTAPEQAIATNLSYQPFGPVAGYSHGNALQTTLAYDLDYRIDRISTDGAGVIYDRAYSHDVTDNINAILNGVDASADQSFSYDGLYRLESATGSYGSVDYQLDGTGNRLSRTQVDGADTTLDSYSYEASSQRLLSVESLLNGAPASSRGWGYDPNGNPLTMTSADGRELETVYGAHNRPVSVSAGGQLLASYRFDGLGQRRIKTLADNQVTHFHYAPNGQLLVETDGSGAVIREYIYADGMHLAMVTGGGSSEVPAEQVLDSEDASIEADAGWNNSTAVAGFIGANYRVHAADGPAEGGIVVDNGDASFSTTGTWQSSTAIAGYTGSNYQHHYANGVSPEAVVLDNVDATVTGTWSSSTSVAGFEGGDYLAAAAGTGAGTVTWETTVVPDSYQVFARWTSHPNRASNAQYTINGIDAQGQPQASTVTVNQQAGGGQDQLLGTFSFADTASVTLSDAADGYVIGDAIRLEAVDAAPNTATWALTADATAEYFLDLRWTAHPNRASDAAYTIKRVGEAELTVVVNQTQGMAQWNSVATLNLAAGETVTVSLSDQANGYVIADAVRLIRTDESTNVLSWPLDIAVAGDYTVEALWTSHPNRASDAAYVIETATGDARVTVNQQAAGGSWQPLGTFALDGLSSVRIDDEANGYVVADGIRIRWADTAANQARLASAGSQLVYFHNDHLGTPQLITDQNQQVVWQGDYLPFGEVEQAVSTIDNPIRFPGQYYDQETGLHYNYFRDYDPSLGWYVQSDPIGLTGGLNTYGYSYQNPIRFTDPFGLEVFVGQHPAFVNSSSNPFQHAAIVLRPDNPADFANHPLFQHSQGREATLGGQAFGPGSGLFGRLTGAPNYPGDAPSNLNDLTQVCAADGRSDSDLIRDLIKAAESYGDNALYDPFPDPFGFTYNSNSYVSGVLEAAGVTPPALPGIRPGYGRPLPLSP